MKPRIESLVWTNVSTGDRTRHWHVWFRDTCGCEEGEDFTSFAKALRFALHIANGGDRWTFA